MTLVAQPLVLTPAATGPVEAAAPVTVELTADLAAVAPLWRALEAAPECVATPFQRLDWAAAFADAHALELRVAVVREGDRPVALLPLTVEREHGVRVARFAGGRHASFGMPVYASVAAAARVQDLPRLLRPSGRAAGIDAFELSSMPESWEGCPNPLAREGRAAASDAYGLLLGPDEETTLRRAFSADARKKLRSKARKLAEHVGPVEGRRIEAPAEVERVLAAFLAQKAARFGELGIDDPFAGPAMRGFLRRACLPEGGRPAALELYALLAADGRVLATFAGAVDGRRFSGMLNSFDGAPDIARGSPGDQLLYHLIADQARRGRTAFDLGVGEARYKSSICDEVVSLRDLDVAVSARGWLWVVAASPTGRLKRAVKRDRRLWALATTLRRLRGRLRPR